MRVGIFDSGIGGLTFLKELLNKKPNNEYIYIGDTLNMPYGAKTKEELYKCVSNIMNYFVKEKVDVVIIACGTVSSTLLNDLKSNYNVNIIDAINPTINYISSTSYKNIGIVATLNTINSHVFKNRLKDKNVYELPLPKLASMIEHNDSEIYSYLDGELKVLNPNELDLLVLGCTHYPIINDYFISKGYKTLNMAMPITKLVSNDGVNDVKIYFTKLDSNVINNTYKILNIKNVNEITL